MHLVLDVKGERGMKKWGISLFRHGELGAHGVSWDMKEVGALKKRGDGCAQQLRAVRVLGFNDMAPSNEKKERLVRVS